MNNNQAELVHQLQQEERVTEKTASTMRQLDRKYFLDPDNPEMLRQAYQESCNHSKASLLLLLLVVLSAQATAAPNRITLVQ